MTMLERRAVVKVISQKRADSLIITGLGSSSYDLHAAGDDDRNFYLWGAMGGTAMMGLGLALSCPTRPVLVITGDGEQLMGMGALATIGAERPENLGIIVLDNGHFGETGMQQSHTSKGIDLIGVAQSCGFAQTMQVSDKNDLESLLELLPVTKGCLLACVKVASQSPARSLPVLDGVELKNRFRRTLSLAPL